MSHVQVRGVPASATPGELRALFEQCGAVRQLVCQFEAGAAEGSALVVFADRAAAQEAADLLDSYPLGTSLLEVQLVNPDQFVGLLVSSILAAQHPPTREAGEQHAAAAGSAAHAAGVEPGGVAALEAEMRALQLQLQQQADAVEGAAAAALAQQRERAWEAYSYGAQEGAGAQDEWQEASPRPRRHQQQQQQQPSPSPLQQGASGDTAGELPNKGLWVGWISREAQEEGVRRAFSRWGPVQVECLRDADRLADNGKLYKWAVLRYKDVSHAVAAKRATERQHLPGISAEVPLKVVFYTPGRVARTRTKA
ncbi:hypothetical protein ABPG77_005695 [Micractinium sp. CCAP 211/92]